ncbi:hypothetical protein C5167_036157, partial [Papaver somniferum]
DEKLRKAVESFKGNIWKRIGGVFFLLFSSVFIRNILVGDLLVYLVEEKSNVCIDGERFFIQTWKMINSWSWSMDPRRYSKRVSRSHRKAMPRKIVKENNMCSFRWHNHLNQENKRDGWTVEAELALMNGSVPPLYP